MVDRVNDIYASEKYFRPKTKLPTAPLNILLNDGGLGDFICRIPSIMKLLGEYQNVFITLWSPSYFLGLAENFLHDFGDRCKVRDKALFADRANRQCPFIDYHSRLIRPLGINLMRFAHQLLLHEDPTDRDLTYPKFNSEFVKLKKFSLPRNYAVITTAATVGVRALEACTVQGLTDYTIARGLTPVFLGSDRSLEADYKGKFTQGFDYSKGLDLRNKTTIQEAGAILDKARFVVGLDNGLLHLAACTETNVIMAFSTVKPEHRICNRQCGKPIHSLIPDEHVKCRFCQSNMKMLFGHDFRNCLYGDFLCVKSLTADKFIEKLDLIFNDGPL